MTAWVAFFINTRSHCVKVCLLFTLPYVTKYSSLWDLYSLNGLISNCQLNWLIREFEIEWKVAFPPWLPLLLERAVSIPWNNVWLLKTPLHYNFNFDRDLYLTCCSTWCSFFHLQRIQKYHVSHSLIHAWNTNICINFTP